MPTVKAMTITIDCLLPRLKLNCDVSYDAAVKGASVAVTYMFLLIRRDGDQHAAEEFSKSVMQGARGEN
jgi:hypothetical protein